MNGFKKDQLARFGLIFSLLALILFVVLKVMSNREASLSQTKELPLSVTAVESRIGSVARQMIFSGPIVGRDEVPIYSELGQGRIDKVLVEAGDHIKAGAILATIDTTYLRIQKAQQLANQQRASIAIKQQENALEEAQTQLLQAQTERKRGDLVAESGLISKEVRDQRVTAEQLAKTHVQSLKNTLDIAHEDFNLAVAQVAESDLRLNQAAIRSPVSGMLIERKAKIGMSIAQNSDPLFNVLRDDDVEVELEVSADDATRLNVGMPVSIQMAGEVSVTAPIKSHSSEEVLSVIDSWAKAWAHKDIATYLSFYGDGFEPQSKIDKAAWVEQRKKRLATKDSISISLAKVNIAVSGDNATAEFLQHYSAKSKKEENYKRLTLKFVNGTWGILREQIIAQSDMQKSERSAVVGARQGNSYKGKISRAATLINRQNQIAKVRVRFDQVPNVILGQFARVIINTNSRNGIYLPETAVRFEGSSAYVFAVKEGFAKRQLVKVGQHIGNQIEIIDGVPSGLMVIDSAASFLRDGEPVKVSTRSVS